MGVCYVCCFGRDEVIDKSRKSDKYIVFGVLGKKFSHTKSGEPARTLTARNWNKMGKSTIGRLSRKYKHGGCR